MNPGRAQYGFIMLPVVVALTLLATMVYLMSRDAGMGASLAGRGLDADAARYVAEAGLARMNYRTQTANCSGYGSLNNVAFGADSFSASAAPASGTPVTLQATATTAGGATTTLTRSNVVVRKTTPYTLTFQPGPDGFDSHIDSSNTTKNYGADKELELEGGRKRGLLRFDLSSIPATAYVQSAQLMVYKEGGAGGPSGSTLTAYALTQTWTEGTLDGGSPADGATWNTYNGTSSWTAGGAYDAASGVAIASTGSDNLWLSWDITSLVTNWVGGSSANNGLLLIPSASVPNQKYVSGDDADKSTRWPKLVVTFLPPCGWTAGQTVTLNPTADGQVNGASPNNDYGNSNSMLAYETGTRRSLVHFNTSTVPTGTPLVDAKLRLYVASIAARSGSPMPVQVRSLTQSWLENSFTWNQRTGTDSWSVPGGDFAGSDAAALILPATFNSGWIEFDITALAQAWVDGVIANNGVILRATAADQISVATKEGGTTNAPQLVIRY